VYFAPGTFIQKSFDLYDLIRLVPGANLRNLETNDIYFISKTFGIEAVKTYLLKEIRTVLGAEGMDVNYRHVSVLVDNMLVDGEIRGNKYSGLQIDDSVILKATFQEASSTFSKAAGKGLTDSLTDVSSQIMLGQLPSLGTAYSHLVDQIVEKEEPSPEYSAIDSPEYAPDSPEYEPSYDGIDYFPTSPITSQYDDDEILMPDMDI
jgi:DNA-directed RNA polymerase I subunit RPA1